MTAISPAGYAKPPKRAGRMALISRAIETNPNSTTTIQRKRALRRIHAFRKATAPGSPSCALRTSEIASVMNAA